MGYRRKTPAVLLCKSIVISIQWFQILHIITFSTIYNLAVLFSGARVSQSFSLVPQLEACRQILQKQFFTSQHFIHLRTWPFCLMGEVGEENFRLKKKKKKKKKTRT